MEPDFTPAGRLKYFLPEWRELTSDPHIPQTVKGFNVEFLDRSLHKSSPKEIPFNPHMNVWYTYNSYSKDLHLMIAVKLNTIHLFNKVGFLLYTEKSIVIPSHQLTFLGFILNSLNKTTQASSQEVSEVIGVMISVFPGVNCAQLLL